MPTHFMRVFARIAQVFSCSFRASESRPERTPRTAGSICNVARIRIAFVSHVFWPEKRRGGERLIRDLSDGLIAHGDSVRLITSHRGRPSRRQEDGLEVVRQWRPPERPFSALGYPAGTSASLGALVTLRRGRDDVVQGWTAPAALAAAHSRRPSVYVFQGVLHEDDLRHPRVRELVTRAARRCSVVTAYSGLAASEFARLVGVEARAIQPGIRLDVFSPGGSRSASPTVLCAADPDEPRKRVGLLVDAFRELRRDVPDAELWLMRTANATLLGEPGVRIVDPGADQTELIRLYRSAWVSVLPAFREAFGLVVAESLACGTPAVTMSDGGAASEVAGATGSVAEPDPAALARALRTALAAPPDAATAAACRKRAEVYSIDRCVERYRDLYREIA
jgi:glycosyltransferase involved in cell wall biosynthesis